MHLSEATAPDTVLEHDAVEIQQQPKLDAAEPKTGHQLGFVDPHDMVDGLDLDDQAVFHHQIYPVATIQFVSLVLDRKFPLPGMWNAGSTRFKAQAFFIGTFQQPRPEVAMHLNGQPNNLPCQSTTLAVVHRTSVFPVMKILLQD
jgi:hypothetical protein